MKRIICIGNRYCQEDAAGSLVYDHLAHTRLPADVELIEGGLAGLDLLRFVENSPRVVFVDAVDGFHARDKIVVLDAEQAARHADSSYGHAAGLGYLLRVLPQVCEAPPEEVFLVGIEGDLDAGVIREAAELSVAIAVDGGVTMLRERKGDKSNLPGQPKACSAQIGFIPFSLGPSSLGRGVSP